jgi:hypothetical protein
MVFADISQIVKFSYLAHLKLQKFGVFTLFLFHEVPEYVCFHPKTRLRGISTDIIRSFLTPHCKKWSLAPQRFSQFICDNLADMKRRTIFGT